MKTSIQTIGSQLWLAGLLLAQLNFLPANAQDTTPPSLVSSSPTNHEANVALDSKIIFTFSEAMQTPTDYSTAIFWGGGTFDSTQLAYAWSAGNTVLTCTYSGDLPGATTITWTLIGGFGVPGFGFSDLAGNGLPLFPPIAGSFTTLGGATNNCTGAGNDDRYDNFSLYKSASYIQTSAGAPVPDTANGPFAFGAGVTLGTNHTANSATLAPPAGSPQSMTGLFPPTRYFFLQELTNDLVKLDAKYPVGNYTFNVTSNGISRAVIADFPAGDPTNAPHVSNYTAAQTIDAALDFTYTWDRITTGTVTDFLLVLLTDQGSGQPVFQSPDYGCPGWLNGTSNSIVFPANFLSPNKTYDAEILFTKLVTLNTNSASGAILSSSHQTTTKTTVATGTGGVTPPPLMVLTNVVWLPSGQFQFQFPTAPGTTYMVDYNLDVGDPLGWTQLVSSNAAAGTIQVTDGPHPGTPSRIYRTRHN